MPAVFGYWSLKGLGQMCRFMLEYTGEQYQDNRFDAPNSREKWEQEKKHNPYKLAFPNLPYYVDGDVRLTQSVAIMRHLARKHGLAANNEQEQQQLDMLEGQAQDLRIWFAFVCYSQNEEGFNGAKAMFHPRMIDAFKLLDEYLGTKKWFLGNRISYVDFIIYDLMCNYSDFDASILDNRTNLCGLKKRFEVLPKIGRYIKSDKFIKWPLNGPTAYFGGK